MMIYFAPVQGHTDAAYRQIHSEIYGEFAGYCTPFIRLEKGEIRKKDLKDAAIALSPDSHTEVQVIFKDYAELSALVSRLYDDGHREININMGCPFPLQTAKGRGAATICRPECAVAVAKVVSAYPDANFSVKMRLGMDGAHEWFSLLEMLDDLPLKYIALHPRTAHDQYAGDLNLEEFRKFLLYSENPVVYNGDILTPADYQRVVKEFPDIAGVMIGRGALGRPSLIAECATGIEWSHEQRLQKMLEFHDTLLDYYRNNLEGGDHQILSKIQPFWEYAEAEIGRNAWKALKKASNMAKYETALAMIGYGH